MAANISHTDFVPISTRDQVPSCKHGPALLFERFERSYKSVRQFFACSAFRDRKVCNFFKWADEVVSSSHVSSQDLKLQDSTHQDLRKRFRAFKKLQREDRRVCCSCGLLLLPAEVDQHKSEGHLLKSNVGLKSLHRVSTLFQPLVNNKTFAQYLFSKSTVDFLTGAVSQLSYTHVLCIGAPRIHEEIQCMKKNGDCNLKSFLLDLDDRYAQVYPPSCFAKYNMFNNHFFEAKGRASAHSFLAEGGENTILITDPPFGGMVEPLANSFIELANLHCHKECNSENSTGPKECNLPLIWFFPYFMENRIVNCMPKMSMLDYKVEYDNHSLYKTGVKKKGSPVRMFTNLPQKLLKLPEEEGYWYCEMCQRFSSSENWHCPDCSSCTSKDGSRYVHCDMCSRCVKPSRVHCFQCGSCQIQDHVCGQTTSKGCFICGELDHKRRDCPKKSTAQSDKTVKKSKRSLKRYSTPSEGKVKKRKK